MQENSTAKWRSMEGSSTENQLTNIALGTKGNATKRTDNCNAIYKILTDIKTPDEIRTKENWKEELGIGTSEEDWREINSNNDI